MFNEEEARYCCKELSNDRALIIIREGSATTRYYYYLVRRLNHLFCNNSKCAFNWLIYRWRAYTNIYTTAYAG